MLGSAFFRDAQTKYDIYEEGVSQNQGHVRNGLWVRAIEEMPVIASDSPKKTQQEDGVPLIRKIRQKTTVSHLILSMASSDEKIKVISHDTGAVSFHTYMLLVLTEATGIATAITVMMIWRSWFALLWVAPLILKLLSAVCTVPREGLAKLPLSNKEKNEDRQVGAIKKFEITNNGNGFLVLEGDDVILLQFFRHYGHPIRSRAHEIIQLAIIVGFGSIFPVGLLCSLVWMPPALQYVWLGHQSYAIIAMHTYRYASGHQCATTEEMIGQEFARAESSHQASTIIFGDSKQTRVCVTLIRTPHDSFLDGKSHVSQLLGVSEKNASTNHDATLQPRRQTILRASAENVKRTI